MEKRPKTKKGVFGGVSGGAAATVATLAATIALLLLVATPVAVDPAKYEKLGQEFVAHAQAASKAFNAKRPAEAQAAVQRARAVFDAAVAMAPDEPQAYAHMATFQFNMHEFEASIAMWHEALARVTDAKTKNMLAQEIRKSKYGLASTRRDSAYAAGQGNISLALEHCHAQLALQRSPNTLFDMATLEVMLSETDPSKAGVAMSHFAASHTVSLSTWLAGLQHHDRCAAGGEFGPGGPSAALAELATYGGVVAVHGDAAWGSTLDLTYRAAPAKLRTFETPVFLSGPDGVIVSIAEGETPCTIHRAWSSDVFVNLPRQVRLLDLWSRADGTPAGWDTTFASPNNAARPVRFPKAVSVVQYAAVSYFHFVMEVLPRLQMALPLLQHDSALHLILPARTDKTRFIAGYLGLLPGFAAWEAADPTRVVEYPSSVPNELVLRVDRLVFPDWAPVQHAEPTHTLTPQPLLVNLRDTLTAALAARDTRARNRVLYYTRATDKMRRLQDEDELVERLKAAVQAPWELFLFDGKDHDVPATLAIFQSAVIVVGVHGGGLASIIGCREGTLLVELGFRSPFARHYAHASQALGLEYQLELLQADERSVGANLVHAAPGSFARIADTVASKLASLSSNEPRRTEL